MVADQLAPQNGLFQYDTETQEGQPTFKLWTEVCTVMCVH